MLDLPGLIDSYGYVAVAIGAFLEGETILALAGLAAYRGYLDFYTVVVVAAVCGFGGDQFYFWLGRYRGAKMLARFPDMQESAHRFDELLTRWHAPLIVAIRFMYGFRIVGLDTNVAIPKRGKGELTVTLKVDTPGRYEFHCNRMCGAGHNFMRGELVVRERAR